MGSSESAPEPPLALPRQHIVNVQDQNAPLGPESRVPSVVGTTREAVAIRAAFAPVRGGLRLAANGSASVELSARIDGTLEAFAPALVRGHSEWPTVEVPEGGQHVQRRVPHGDARVVPLALTVERRDASELPQSGGSRWPVVLLLRPDGEGSPPDGALLICCAVRGGQLEPQRQLVASRGSAFEVHELFGIQEAQRGPEGAGGGCVICLTAKTDTALMPCGHFCVCYECGAALRLAPARNRCPLCRREVHDIVRIDVAAEAAPLAGESVDESPPAAQPVVEAEQPSPPSAEDMRAARLRALDPAAVAAEGELPPRCLQRLTRELRQIEQQRAKLLEEHNLELALRDPEGGDLRVWLLSIHTQGVDAATALGKELRAHQVATVELEVWIPDRFPVEPPRVRVLRPCFGIGSFWVQQHGALCMEALTTQGWTPAMSLPQLGVQVKTMMSQGHGKVSGSGNMGDPGPGGRQAAWNTFRHVEAAHKDWQTFSTG